MKKMYLILCLFICLKGFSQNKKIISIDTSKIAILPYNSTQNIFINKCQETKLNNEDILTIESILKKCVDEYNFKEKTNNLRIDIKEYRRQYLAITNKKGEKEVWINCFCQSINKNWKKEILKFSDGGACYFNFKINITQKNYYDLYVNNSGS
jgi:hypothetical protein